MRRFLLCFIFLVLFLPLACAQGLVVERTLPETARAGDALTVAITVSNPSGEDADVLVKEMTYDYFDFVEPQPEVEQWQGLRMLFFTWPVVVPAQGEAVLTYEVIPRRLGEYTLSGTKVLGLGIDAQQGEPSILKVLCRADGVCDTEANEDYVNCPEDCKSGIGDEKCDFEDDGVCDPDCEPRYDADCAPEPGPAPAPRPTEPVVGEALAEAPEYSALYASAAVVVIAVVAAFAAVILMRRIRAR